MGRRRTYKRDDVLEKARDHFWKTGYEGAHLSDLVEATGLNRFSLYKEFGGKEGLFQEALELYASEGEAHYKRMLDVEPLGLGNIFAYFESLTVEAGYHGCLMVNTLTEQAVVPSRAFDAARDFFDRAEARFRINLDAAVDAEDLPEQTDVDGLVRAVMALDTGLAVQGILHPGQETVAQVTKAVRALLASVQA